MVASRTQGPRQFSKVAIVDDDEATRASMEVMLDDLSLQPVPILGEFGLDVDRLVGEIITSADCAICDHRLQHSSFARFDGAEVVAKLYDHDFPGILITQYLIQYGAVTIRKWRQKISVLISREEAASYDRLLECLEMSVSEVRNKTNLPPHRRPRRSLVHIVQMDEQSGVEVVDAIIPNWNPREAVRFPSSLIPEEYRGDLVEGARYFANVNTGANSSNDLYFSDFEKAPAPDPSHDLT